MNPELFLVTHAGRPYGAFRPSPTPLGEAGVGPAVEGKACQPVGLPRGLDGIKALRNMGQGQVACSRFSTGGVSRGAAFSLPVAMSTPQLACQALPWNPNPVGRDSAAKPESTEKMSVAAG